MSNNKFNATNASLSVDLSEARQAVKENRFQDALDLFHEWTLTDSLRRHGYAVEAAMGYYAKKLGEDEEKWRITGLLHDMDYERHQTMEEHPYVGVKYLKEKGYPEDVLDAILGHANHTGHARETLMAKVLSPSFSAWRPGAKRAAWQGSNGVNPGALKARVLQSSRQVNRGTFA